MGDDISAPNGTQVSAIARAGAYLLALLSGAMGLAIQSVLLRQAQQFFGATAQVTAIVVAVSLAGLALGGVLVAPLADRAQKPLRLAAVLLALCGVCAAAGSELANFVEQGGLFAVVATFPSAPLGGFGWLLLAVLLVLPANVLLGAVLPALARASIYRAPQLQTMIGSLYSLEALGAAVSAIVTAFLLIPAFGQQETLWLVTATAALVCGMILLLPLRTLSAEFLQQATFTSMQPPVKSPGDAALIASVVLLGVASLGMEIVWIRLLILVLGGDNYSYAIVVASFLFGIAVGATLARCLAPRLAAPLRTLAWLQLGAAGSSLAILPLFAWLACGPGQRWLATLAGDSQTMLAGRFALCFALLLLPAILLGGCLPVAASHWMRSLGGVSRRSGRLFAASAAGNVAGSLAAGFVLLGAVGVQASLVVFSAIALGAAAAAVIAQLRSRGGIANGSFKLPAAWWFQAIVVGLAIGYCVGWPWFAPSRYLAFDEQSGEFEVVYYREGPVATVMVMRDRIDSDRRLMSVDGVVIGESRGGVDEKQQMLAHLPFLLRPPRDSQKILTIGLGTGILSGELARQTGVAKVVCVELSPAVIEAARRFNDLNGRIFADPRVTVACGDGVAFLRAGNELFDAIVSDAKSRPGHAGNAAFFSRDYYQLCRSRLTDDGVLVQWLSMETPPHALRIMLHTFIESFPHSYIAVDAPDAVYLIGGKQALALDAAQMQRHLQSAQAAHLRRYGWGDACDLMSAIIPNGESLRNWLGNGIPVNTRQRPALAFEALEMFRTSPEQRTRENLRAFLQLASQPSKPLPVAGTDPTTAAACRDSLPLQLGASISLLSEDQERFERAIRGYEEAVHTAPRLVRCRQHGAELCRRLATAAQLQGDRLLTIDYFRRAVLLQDHDGETHQRLFHLLKEAGAYTEAAQHGYDALSAAPENTSLRVDFGMLLLAIGKQRQAASQFRQALETAPDDARAHLGLGVALGASGQQEQSADHLQRAVELDPRFADDAVLREALNP